MRPRASSPAAVVTIMPRMQALASARRLPLVVAVACAVAVAAAGPGAASRTADDRVVHTVRLEAGQALAIAITGGTIRVTGDSRRKDIRLEVVRQAPTTEALAQVPIALTEGPGGPRLSVTQVAGGTDPGIRTDVTVSAPPDIALDAVTIAEGRLELRGIHGAVRATVARGAIVADDVSGVLRLETTIGPIDVTGARLGAEGLIRLRTFNGDVHLALAAPLADARVMALVLNGTIASTVPLTMKDGWGPRWGEATIGRPDRILSIDVVTGTIRIDAPGGR